MKKILCYAVLLSSIILAACKNIKPEVNEITSEYVTAVTKNEPETTKSEIETTTTKESEMEYNPFAELEISETDGSNGKKYVTYSHNNMVITDKGDKGIVISNGNTSIENIHAAINVSYNSSLLEKSQRIFFSDLTGDGVEELIIRIPDIGGAEHMHICYIYDTATLQEISYSEDIYTDVSNYIVEGKVIRVDKDTLEYFLKDSHGRTYLKETKNKLGSTNIDFTSNILNRYIYFENNKMYFVQAIGFYNTNSYISCHYSYIIGESEYDKNTNAMVLNGNYQIVEEYEVH